MGGTIKKHDGPDYEAKVYAMRDEFYEREKKPERQAASARLHELGVKVGAHKKKEKK